MTHHMELTVAGGEEEAQTAYVEAFNAVFHLEVQCHRHTQLQRSKDGIGTRWSMIEMWPMLVTTHCPVLTSTLSCHLLGRGFVKKKFEFTGLLWNSEAI